MVDRITRLGLGGLLLTVALLWQSVAVAGLLRLAPVRVFLDEETRAAVVELSNPADAPINVQVDAFRWTGEAGIESAAHVILGLPGETPATIGQTLKLVRRIKPDYVQYYGAIPFPGTSFLEQARREGWLASENWEDYEINKNVISTLALSAEELGRWRRRAYLSFYLRPSYMLGRLRRVKSSADALNLCRAGLSFLRDWALTGGDSR